MKKYLLMEKVDAFSFCKKIDANYYNWRIIRHAKSICFTDEISQKAPDFNRAMNG